MANKEHLAILKQGVKAWNEWRGKNPSVKINLGGVYLYDTDLSGINLSEAILLSANLSKTVFLEANFNCAILNGANLRGANLRKSNLSKADLSSVDLGWANLREARLLEADLTGANLSVVDLNDANLSEAEIGYTSFENVDLSQVKYLEKVKHHYPSSIGIDTIYRSKGNIPEVFLRGCGIPEDMIAYVRVIRSKTLDLQSCFISHSAKDKPFCERLYADLQAKGVRAWLFEEDAKWGETVWGEIDRSIKVYDKLIVVCSENSLQSGPVNREIERALNREDKEGKGILFPIRVDDYIFDKWEHERKADVVRKVVGDFSGWDKDAAKYDKAFDKLLKGLQAA